MTTGTRIVLGTCHHDCPDSCGWEVTVEDGRAVRLRGNPAHPYSQGELCPKVNRFLDRVYSPDRVLTPLILDGPKGSGRFRAATWDEALALVASRLHSIVDRWGGEAVVPWGDAGTQGAIQMSGLSDRFFARLGSSVQVDDICGGVATRAYTASVGSGHSADPLDVQHSRFIVLWGTNTRLTNRHLWPSIETARAQGAKVVVIDPVRTVTADAADWFLQPRPGTDVAFMLAVMHVVIRRDLHDAEYVERHTSGFDALAAHVADWTPERAAAVTGLPAEVIEQFSVEYATTAPAMIRTLIGAEHRLGGAQFFRTLAFLPTLIGSWQHVGGGLARSTNTWARMVVDGDALGAPHLAGDRPRRPISMNHIGHALLDPHLDPPVKALVVWNGNPLVSLPEAGVLREGLLRDDLFTVVSEQFITDTARHADVVFPACTQIEQRDVVAAWGHLHLGWNEQAIEPLGDSVPNTELWRRLSRAMGYTEPELFATDDELIAACLPNVDLAELQRTGFTRYDVPSPVLPYADGFSTPDGRFAFDNPELEQFGIGRLPTFDEFRPEADASSRYPLSLMSPKTHQRFLNSSYSNLPKHATPEGGIYCEIHPLDAAARGVHDGDMVEVANERGTLRAPARVSDQSRVAPGLVVVPFGWITDSTPDGRTVNELTNGDRVPFGGAAFFDTQVQVTRVT